MNLCSLVEYVLYIYKQMENFKMYKFFWKYYLESELAAAHVRGFAPEHKQST